MRAVVVVLVVLGACASSPRPVEVLPVGGLSGRSDFEHLGAVLGRSCAYAGVFSAPTEEAARADVRTVASRRGADAVIAVRCQPVTMYGEACGGMTGYQCEADAVRFLRR